MVKKNFKKITTIVVDQITKIVVGIATIVVFSDNCGWCCDNCGCWDNFGCWDNCDHIRVSQDSEHYGEAKNTATPCFARQTGSDRIFLPVIDLHRLHIFNFLILFVIPRKHFL